MNTSKVCEKYCIGCGLCKNENGVTFSKDSKGFIFPSEGLKKFDQFLNNVCPIADDEKQAADNVDLWGKRSEVYSGFSSDAEIRKKASSGGVLTALAVYLLKEKKVDGIIQIKADPNNPTRNVIAISKCVKDVISCCGSRYSISSPWLDLNEYIEEGKTYAAIAKPCDIKALRRLQNNLGRYANIKYLFSFFCAGLPSADAQKVLLNKLNCGVDNIKELTYRGNGWPGMTTAVDNHDVEHTMKYADAWGGILGRDVHPFCRLCMDGIGEAADVACGDGWYLTDDGQPDFSEKDGRNVIFPRTQLGDEILQEAVKKGYLEIEKWNSIEDLKSIQKYQFSRKATMRSKLLAYKLFGKPTPKYDHKTLKKYAQFSSIKDRLRIFLGTSKRIIQKKI